ncbi:nuclease [Shewanella sp. Choline-02u-19]|uniref:thermonuclease family protein n=1 Tax=unclassified Shewanella TaxID=196818 RepID=UPI000C31DA1E|nr:MULTISPECIES: thermonuclease family protein [unclassified Shewanella]PKH60389.1 nuclease [Shewanella sp. Bg11-22]PKI29148.1 nuclease [Shewanella sp. Choline-02u-19]
MKININSIIYPLLIIISLCSSIRAFADYGNAEVSRVISVYDGDTFKADIKGYQAVVGTNISIRVANIDTAEIRAGCSDEKVMALKGREFTLKALSSASVIELRDIKRGKYFRLVADVYIDGVNLGSELRKAGLAVEYGKEHSWCRL